MGWATEAARELEAGRAVKVRPIGGSMRGRIESGQLVTLVPVDFSDLSVGDAVFVRWKRSHFLHLVKELAEDRVLIGNNLGRTNGWVASHDVLGKAVAVED